MREGSRVRLDVHLDDDEVRRSLVADAAAGLTASPKELAPKWFYDECGSRLFEAITRLDEYYPFRRERDLLAAHAPAIARCSGADTLVELGSGTSEKTLLLLDALDAAGRLRGFVPFDCSREVLVEASERIARRYGDVWVHAVAGDLDRHIDRLPAEGSRLVAFLGGTIGNFVPAERGRLLGAVAQSMRPGEHLLVGCDLVKDPARLVAAYDDARGVTAQFNKNVLVRLNRELGARFVIERFEHVVRFSMENEWIEMRLRSTLDQTVRIAGLEAEIRFARGEEMRTEVSAKFRRCGMERELRDAGFASVGWWTDRDGDYALSLSRRAG